MPGPYVINEEGTGYAKIDEIVIPTLVSWKKRDVDPKNISVGRPGGLRGSYEKLINYSKELELVWENMTLEAWAKICGGDVTLGAGASGILAEEVGPAVAGVLPALTVLPVRTNSEACWVPEADGTLTLCHQAAVPADEYEYTIVDATGVITTVNTYTGNYFVSYGGEVAAASVVYTEDDSDVVAACHIQIIERAHSLMQGQEGGSVVTFPNCMLKGRPEFGASREESQPALTVVYAIGGEMSYESVIA